HCVSTYSFMYYCVLAMFLIRMSISYIFAFLLLPPPPRSTLFPYTTLFRSRRPSCRHRRGRTSRRCRGRSRSSARVRRACRGRRRDRKSTRLNSSHGSISYAVFCLKKKKKKKTEYSKTKYKDSAWQ